MKVSQQSIPEEVDEDIYRLLVASVPDYAIFQLDPEGIIRTWNLGAQNIKGYRADEIIGRHFSVFYPEERIAEGWPQHELDMARATGRFEDGRLRKDGTRFWANVLITRLEDERGVLRGFSKITRDLTARREHEELLRRSEERFRLIVDGVSDYAIFMLDPEGTVVSWNAGAERAKGYRADEIIGQHFSVFYPDEVVTAGWPARELELALRDGRLEDEGWRVRKDGSRFWASVVITSLRDDSGRHIGFAKVTRDLTEKRRVVALEDEGRRMTTFLAMLGHELRNPLAPIANAVAIMQMEPIASQSLRMCRDVIARQLGQMTRLVDDLLDVGRITHGKIRIDFHPVETGSVLAEAVEAVEAAAVERGQALSILRPPGEYWIHGDRARMLQVMSNLLGNASKFTPHGGRIVASLRSTPQFVELAVADNGPGIPAHRTAEIFLPFVQGERDPASPQSGLGLGLSLVQQLVAMHDGQISVFSTGKPGEGTEFVVRLPRIEPPEGVQAGAAATESVLAHDILIVDDNRDAADTLSTLLRTRGHRVRAVYNGADALAAVTRRRPDLVFPGHRAAGHRWAGSRARPADAVPGSAFDGRAHRLRPAFRPCGFARRRLPRPSDQTVVAARTGCGDGDPVPGAGAGGQCRPPSSGYGLIAVPFHHCFSGPSSKTAKCRWGADGLALPVLPT
ncbi:PAS domain S-box protein [Lysobacter solisilvae]|uniref:histidine kinase n=1 Tax=Agrilutibacter solisilvae TaxID=2763317 RepID=A0A974Y5M8_9GAMM|nr:PAS domain S-box protein [Lysobacter solisilvae]